MGYFADARDERLFYCLCERSAADSTARPPFVALMRATSPVSSGEFTPKEEARFVLLSLRAERSNLPGGCRSTEYMSRTFSVGLPQSLRSFAMTVDFPCHRERKRGDPLEKVRGAYTLSLKSWDISLTLNMTWKNSVEFSPRLI